MRLLKDILRVTSSNVINFGSSFLVGFVLPFYLSVSEYGYYKEFTLFLNYVYLLNLGYNDGITIKYGGKDPRKLKKDEFRSEHTFLVLFQLIVLILTAFISIYLRNVQLLTISLVAYFICLTMFHLNFLQATGEFKTYANTNILKTAVNIITILIGIVFLKNDSHLTFVIMNILTNIITTAFLEMKYYKKYGLKTNFEIKNNFNHFKVGFFILIANMSLNVVGNIGSWIVNLGFSIEKFALYSFSTSLLNMILLIVNSVGLIFYNIIAKKENFEKIKFSKRILLILGIIGGEIYFIFKLIVELFLPEYIASLSILSITFISIPYIMISKILIANLYKARKNGKKYFRDMILLALISIIIVSLSYVLTKDMIVIAFSTLFVYAGWYFYSTTFVFDYLRSSKQEYILLFSHLIIFYVTANNLSMALGSLIYFIFILVIIYFFRKDFYQVIQYIKK